MMHRFDGPPPPAGPPVQTWKVLRPQAVGELDLTVLSERFRSVACHWVWDHDERQGRTHICTEPRLLCAYHREKVEWNGFLAVCGPRRCVRAVLRSTPAEAGVLLAALGSEGSWKGVRITVTPFNDCGKKIRVALASAHAPASRLDAHDVTPTLCALFGVARLPDQTPISAAEAAGPVNGIDEWVPIPETKDGAKGGVR